MPKIFARCALLLAVTLGSSQVFAALYITNPTDFGTPLATISSCDDCAEEISFPGTGQSVNFYGTTYSAMWPSSNGLIAFGSGYTGYTPQPIDEQTFRPMIAGLFTDLDARPPRSTVYLNNATPGQVVITWQTMSRFSQDSTNSTFQLVVRSDQFSIPAGEGQIGLFYGSIDTPSISSAGFGDGLAAVNEGEVALFSQEPANTHSDRAGSWYTLGAGGIAGDSPAATAAPVPVLPAPLMVLMIAMMALVGGRYSLPNLYRG